ncbi:hypothetical protein BHE74_00007258 [Ensete ventricosum]|nr:hypothetical protein GW17_00032412 [Ensete ventricosum]RWW84143.1 hypothetical protein BHE74_00007258 [Ensete ventricosum]RZR77694.1 hypothetical protein BHM03_00002806 [Ensete ventricosum]
MRWKTGGRKHGDGSSTLALLGVLAVKVRSSESGRCFDLFCSLFVKVATFVDAGDETDVSATGSGLHDPLRMVWRKGFIRLVLVSAILWMLLILFALLFHLWSCHSSISFFSGDTEVAEFLLLMIQMP